MSPASGKLTLTPVGLTTATASLGLGPEGTVKPKIFDVSSTVNSDRRHIYLIDVGRQQ
ncbi:hypothetical protein COO91_09731 (plasmid) [Nostoc flagelliforme CCNUN1]|uniref:Uncharacterized protein n=1 Tax=Nostoc flagelliforme CCNUN1 TaxID=2038116 RepID=A0A2K8T7C8_9NOSO|nr:hypothetical protein [Nostoc flagelliforme]AUB43550.1 hypothetical protein COO91_09731 [Nostoc flagelliforme CCNUN1]